MKSNRIQYTKPSITELEVQFATDATRNGWGEQCYEYIDKFEASFKKHLNVEFAIAASSCTGALHLGLAALGIGQGDEVIMADTNWIATAAPVVYLGAKPVFVDILSDSWCIDPEAIEAAINPRTKAIIAVHLYGNPCDLKNLFSLGEKYNIPVIEDAAEALGTIYHGNRAGSMGKFGCFSFHGTKTITTGEGGMLVTNDVDIFEKALTLSNHGRSKTQSKQFWSDMIGFKYKISNVQAAIGCAQMERIDELIKRKREIMIYYKNVLNELGGISCNPEPEGTVNGFWMPTVVFDVDTGIKREDLLEAFRSKQIDARVFFYPLSSNPIFNCDDQNPNAADIASRAINLPSFHDMQLDDQNRVLEVIQKLLRVRNG